jgi:hypothetical protein
MLFPAIGQDLSLTAALPETANLSPGPDAAFASPSLTWVRPAFSLYLEDVPTGEWMIERSALPILGL